MYCQLPIVWQGYGKKTRSRHKKYHVICEFIDVEIREFNAIDAPVSVQTGDMAIRYFEEGHWYPLSERNSIALPSSGEQRHDHILMALTKTRQDLKSPILTRKPLAPESDGDFYFNEYAHDICTIDEVIDLETNNQSWAMENCMNRLKSIILVDGYVWHKAGAPALYVTSEYQTAGKWEANIRLLPLDALERQFISSSKGDAMFSLETEADIIQEMFPEVEKVKLPELQIMISDVLDERITEINFVNQIKERLDNWWMHISRQRSTDDLSIEKLTTFLKLLSLVQGLNISANNVSVDGLVDVVSSIVESGIQSEEFGQVLSVYKNIKARTDKIDFTNIEVPLH